MLKIGAGINEVQDDIFIYALSKEDHEIRLAAVLKRLNEYNVTLNDKKCVYGVSELEYLVINLSGLGLNISVPKFEAIKAVRSPKDSAEVRSLLGLVQYIAKLLKKGASFVWGVEQQGAFTIPYWPQQNGEVERQNRSMLKRIRISNAEGSDWQEEMDRYLMMYRSIIHSTTGKSPSELLFGRNIRFEYFCNLTFRDCQRQFFNIQNRNLYKLKSKLVV